MPNRQLAINEASPIEVRQPVPVNLVIFRRLTRLSERGNPFQPIREQKLNLTQRCENLQRLQKQWSVVLKEITMRRDRIYLRSTGRVSDSIDIILIKDEAITPIQCMYVLFVAFNYIYSRPIIEFNPGKMKFLAGCYITPLFKKKTTCPTTLVSFS